MKGHQKGQLTPQEDNQKKPLPTICSWNKKTKKSSIAPCGTRFRGWKEGEARKVVRIYQKESNDASLTDLQLWYNKGNPLYKNRRHSTSIFHPLVAELLKLFLTPTGKTETMADRHIDCSSVNHFQTAPRKQQKGFLLWILNAMLENKLLFLSWKIVWK